MIHTMYYANSPSMYPSKNAEVRDFVERHSGVRIESGYCSMAVYDNGQPIAGTIYHNYHPENGIIELSSASISKKWLTKNVINAMFFLAFDRLEAQMVVLRVSELNKVMCAIARKFGFEEVYIPRLRGRNEGEFIFTLTDDKWKSSKYYAPVAG